uniref:Peptidase S1 domain-containing protein n=1 Tax=Oryzias latipes TaxID=8090 RepID=A0A3P9K4A1_ORYLA
MLKVCNIFVMLSFLLLVFFLYRSHVPLYMLYFNMKLSVNQVCSVAGWGKTVSTGGLVDDLRVVNVSIIDHNDCKKSWGKLPPNMICAGGKNTDKGFCQGDSGGPLVWNGKAVGIVSFNNGKNCKYPDVPNVYTDIRKYDDWINNITKNKMCPM